MLVRPSGDGLGQKKLIQARQKTKLASNNEAVQFKTMMIECKMYTYCRAAIARQTWRGKGAM